MIRRPVNDGGFTVSMKNLKRFKHTSRSTAKHTPKEDLKEGSVTNHLELLQIHTQ